MPAHIRKFVEKATSRGADAICLDLEDSVPRDQKGLARDALAEDIEILRSGSSDILVRINKDPSCEDKDLIAACLEGVDGIILPKVKSADDVRSADFLISKGEQEKGLQKNSIKISILIESAVGVERISEILASSKRLTSVTIGHEDLCLDLGINPTQEGQELFYVKSRTIIAARAAGVTPIGLLGTLSNFEDLKGLKKSAIEAYRIGFKGAYCIHPSQVPVLNEAYSPPSEDIEKALKIVQAYEIAIKMGQAGAKLEGMMIDNPVYERAKLTVEVANEVQRRNLMMKK